jgi:L-asparaginase
VVVFAMGGTIAMSASAQGGVTPTLTAHELIDGVPGLADTGIGVDVVDFRRVPGASLDFATLVELTAAITRAVEAGATGVVITQGTDTIEETSLHLDLYHRHAAPVVVTGAMRNPTLAGADGPANLLAAVLTAADPQVRGLGVLVVLHDEIHAARGVRKTHTTALDTFRSPDNGPLGRVVEGRVVGPGASVPRLVLPSPRTDAHPRVGVYTVVLDDDPAQVATFAARLDGLVVAAMGAGHVPEALVEPLAKAATAIPVILTSRTGSGSVLRATYGFPGSERDLIEHCLIPAGSVGPLKARILLRGLLSADADRSLIETAFAVAGQYSDTTAWPWSLLHEEPITHG